MPFPDQREGLLKKVLVLSVFAVFVLTAAKTASVYRSSSQLSDYVRDRALRAAAESVPADRLQAEVARYAVSLGLPVRPGDVRVATHPGTVSIKLDYTVPVNLKLFTWNLRFRPEVESRAY
jgi:hypothetical protein